MACYNDMCRRKTGKRQRDLEAALDLLGSKPKRKPLPPLPSDRGSSPHKKHKPVPIPKPILEDDLPF